MLIVTNSADRPVSGESYEPVAPKAVGEVPASYPAAEDQHATMSSSEPKVVLVGPPGAGKSTIGRRLASALSVSLVDSDQLIEQAEGKSCGVVFAEYGEAKFRVIEAEHVARALKTGGIVSLGGGAVLTESTRDLLADHLVVWVDVSAEQGVERTSKDNSRPVLQAEDRYTHYRNLLDARAPLYREVSDYRVRTDGRTPQQIVADILGFLDTL